MKVLEVGQWIAAAPELGEPRALARREVDGVAEEAARPQQAEALVDAEIVGRLGEEPRHPGDLLELLGEMRLHQAGRRLGPERAERLELLGAGGRREARRDGVARAPAPVPARDQRLGAVMRALRRVAQRVGDVAVHAGQPGGDAHPARLGRGEEGVHACDMRGAEARHAGGAVKGQQVEMGRGHVGGVGRVAEARLRGEGVALQPLDQPLAPGRDDRGLRVVGMGVDEARRDQRVAMRRHRRLGVGRADGLLGPRGEDRAAPDRHRAAPLDAERLLGRGLERVGMGHEQLAGEDPRLG